MLGTGVRSVLNAVTAGAEAVSVPVGPKGSTPTPIDQIRGRKEKNIRAFTVYMKLSFWMHTHHEHG